jgi:hypothetical protein
MPNSPGATEAFLDWYRELWPASGGDSEEAIRVADKRLGLALPALLRGVYRHTSLRRSEMLHLRPLQELEVEGGVLVFADDQQATYFWGIPLRRLSEANPALVAGAGEHWQEEGCALEEFLRFFALFNRPYERPFIDQSSYDQRLLKASWKTFEVHWDSLQHSLWTNGEAVLEEASGNLGARDADALRKAAASLDIDEEEIAAALADSED